MNLPATPAPPTAFPSDLAGLRQAATAYQGTPGFQPTPDMDAVPPQPTVLPPISTPAPPPVPVTHDVTIVTTKKLASAKVMGVPPEEFGIERGARSIRDCNYCFHEVVTKTESQLIAEGFDEEQIHGLTPYTGNTEIETLSRDSVQEHFNTSDGVNPAARPIRITEHYVRMDYEGKGRVGLYQVITGGDKGELLRKDGKDCVTPFDAIPFAATTPVPITHRFFGRSIADLTMPVQREKTALKRGALDNLYLSNNPRVEVPESAAGPNTLDDLLVSRPGGIVRSKVGGQIQWQVVPNITAGIFPMMQYLDAEVETRTGVSKQSQGVDANALQNQSATAVAQVFSASQMRMKLIARVMAEGVRDIFSLLHATIRKHGQEKQTVQLRKKWVDVDPRGWKSRDDMTINVGLGTGGKAQQFAQTMAIGNVQKELVGAGKTNIVDDKKLYNTAAELTKIMGHKSPDQFFNDPDAKGPDGQPLHPAPAPPPDPKAAAITAKAQADQAATAQKAQLDQQQAQLDALHQKLKAESDASVAKLKADLDAKLKVLDAHLQAAQTNQKMTHEAARHAQDTANAHRAHRMDMADKTMGMVAAAHNHDASMEQQSAAPAAKKPTKKKMPEGARQAKDGNHYISDKDRPGKFLMVVHHE